MLLTADWIDFMRSNVADEFTQLAIRAVKLCKNVIRPVVFNYKTLAFSKCWFGEFGTLNNITYHQYVMP